MVSRLALPVRAALRALHVHERRDLGQRRTALAGELHVVGQDHGQILLWNWHDAALRAVDHRNRRAPVTLARDAPVLDAISDGGLAKALLFGVRVHSAARFGARKTRKLAGVR